MRITRYDRASAWMVSVVLACLIGAFIFFLMWFGSRVPAVDSDMVPEVIPMAGGELDGAIDETLKVESPEDVTDDPSQAELPSEETQILETLETVVELSDAASQFVQDQPQNDSISSGKPGSANGTGRAPLGEGGGPGALTRAQRWVIRFGDKDTLDEYARQLDFFGIEFGVVQGNDTITYLSNFSSPTPTKRVETISEEEQRLYMQWQDAGRRKADVDLVKKAGIDAAAFPILHFYPAKTENDLVTKELAFRNKKEQEIRRTYFNVSRRAGGYTFVVTKQLYLR